MPRPSEPLISRRQVAELALEIVDAGGLKALNLRKLAERAGVHVMSLYHHFPNKEAILAAAASLALEDVGHAWDGTVDWRDAFFELGHRLRAALQKHPEMIPVIVRRRRLRIGATEDEAVIAMLSAQGVPESLAPTLFELIESFVVGHVMLEFPATGDRPPPARPRTITYAEGFDFGLGQLIDGFASLTESGPVHH